MADAIKSVLLLVLTEQCFDEYFINSNFFDVPCFKATISKALGLAIIAGSIMVKVPQILKILNSKSGIGISVFGVCLELFAMTANVAYSYIKGFPFSAWGDGIFLGIQTAIIAVLVLFFRGNRREAATFVITYVSILFVLMSGLTPVRVLWLLQACNIPIVFAGKMIQVLTNYKNSNTGQLSAITCFMLLFGSVARTFTSIQETGDTTIIATFCIASLANAVIVGQMIYYWKPEPPVKKSQ